MKTIADRWTDFEARVVAPDAPPLQRDEMRLAFYAGFKSMLDVNFELAGLDELSAVFLLERFHIEARRFGASLDQRRS
ncbi:hypothetical protein [Paraburkholderia humisilvae]|uniref:Uncharacterized protein n=1 Tax=Paraburkholderia humisilvae TaxID=627669 RepID=A0A6J5DWX7_9BURK|nr:hypothetical protein [Paraburkholderia humisilvae]CAB3758473.1 hypothetical protein LMG29542_03349 [Paraburkholderia humisilvae]